MVTETAIIAALTGPKLIESVAASVASRAAGALGSRIFTGARKLRRKDQAADTRIAATLDSYSVVTGFKQSTLELLEGKPEYLTAPVVAFLDSTEALNMVHELLASMLVGSEPEKLNRLDVLFANRFRAAFGFDSRQPDVEDWIEKLSEEVFNYLTDRCADIVEHINTTEPETGTRIREAAAYVLISDTLDAIERHVEAFCNPSEDVGNDREYEQIYRRQVQRLHGTITPPDFDKKRDIPLDDIYVSPEIHRGNTSIEARGHTLDLMGLWAATDRTVLLGEPGGGKSTATGALIHKLSSPDSGVIPYLVVLRDYAQYKSEMSVIEYLEQRLRAHYQSPAPPRFVDRTLLCGRGAVFFDGLDELLDTSARREVTEAVEAFASRYPLAKIFVTSRLVGYQQAPMSSNIFKVYVLSNFSDEKVGEYVKRWFRLEDDITDEQVESLATSFLEESRSVDDLRRNPLMLALMCIIYRGQHFIPKNRPAVYERCATLLFETWDNSRQIKAGLTAEDYLDETLKHLALWMLDADFVAEGVTREQLISETSKYFHGRAFEDVVRAKKAAAEFVDFCKGRAWVFSDAGTTAEGEELYKFTHRTFMEYFAAFELTRLAESPERLARHLLPHVARQEWDMVGQLAVQIENKQAKDGSERTLRAMLNDGRRRTDEHRGNILEFTARCLSFTTLPPALVRQIAAQVWERGLKQGFPYFGAMQSLFAVSSEDALEYISDEFRKAAVFAISSEDVSSVIDGIGLALSVEFFLPGIPGVGSPSRSATWTSARDAILRAHPDALKIAVTDSAGLRQSAVRAGFCSVKEFMELAMVEGALPLDPLFAANVHRPLRIGLLPLAFFMLDFEDTEESVPGYIEELRHVVNGLTADAATAPWVSFRSQPHIAYDMVGLKRLFVSLDNLFVDGQFKDGAVRAGLITSCILAEFTFLINKSWGQHFRLRREPGTDGILLAARAGSVDARAQVQDSTAVPDLVKRWASGELSFVRTGRRSSSNSLPI